MLKMKRLITFTFLLVFTNSLFTQNIAPIGTKWSYNFFGATTTTGSYHLESIGDTIIAGKNCRKLLSQTIVYDCQLNQQNCRHYSKGLTYLHENNDSLFNVTANGVFRLIFQYRLRVNDSFGRFVVTRFVDTMVAGQNLKKWELETTCLDLRPYKDRYAFVEKIGELHNGFGWGRVPCPFNNLRFELCQFSTPNINVGGICTFTQTNEFSKNPPLSIHPNPATNFLKIETPHPFFTYYIFDATGRLIQNTPFTEGLQIDISNLPNGVYLLQLVDKQQFIAHRNFQHFNTTASRTRVRAAVLLKILRG
jgi:hypothetical protein